MRVHVLWSHVHMLCFTHLQDDWSKLEAILYVTAAQLMCGIAKDLTKLGGKTVTKLVTPGGLVRQVLGGGECETQGIYLLGVDRCQQGQADAMWFDAVEIPSCRPGTHCRR